LTGVFISQDKLCATAANETVEQAGHKMPLV
jgi:hypothetical protein